MYFSYVSVVLVPSLRRGRKKNNKKTFLWWITALLLVWGRCAHASVHWLPLHEPSHRAAVFYDVTGDLRQANAPGWHHAHGVSSSGPGNPVGSAHSEQRKMEGGSWRVAVTIRLVSNYRPMSQSVCSAVTARLLLPCGGTRWPLIKRPWAKI